MSTFALIALFTAFLVTPVSSYRGRNKGCKNQMSWIGDHTNWYSTWNDCTYNKNFINGDVKLTCYQQCYCSGYNAGICAKNQEINKFQCQCGGGTHDLKPENKPPWWCTSSDTPGS